MKHNAVFHEGNKPYKCNSCDSRFSFKTLLKQHKSEIHNAKGNFKCTSCQEKFITKNDMKKHVRKFHGRGMDPKSSLDNHVNMEIEETMTYSCKKCESDFKTRNELNKHNTTVHEEKKVFKCVTCSLTFTEKKLLGEHYTSAHGQLPPKKNALVDQAFKEYLDSRGEEESKMKIITIDPMKEIPVHEGKKDEDLIKEHECSICKKVFVNQRYLTKHMIIKHNANHSVLEQI